MMMVLWVKNVLERTTHSVLQYRTVRRRLLYLEMQYRTVLPASIFLVVFISWLSRMKRK